MFTPVPANIYDFQLPIITYVFVERPQMISVGFQAAAIIDQKFNRALYTNENVETMYIQMNNTQYPHETDKS